MSLYLDVRGFFIEIDGDTNYLRLVTCVAVGVITSCVEPPSLFCLTLGICFAFVLSNDCMMLGYCDNFVEPLLVLCKYIHFCLY